MGVSDVLHFSCSRTEILHKLGFLPEDPEGLPGSSEDPESRSTPLARLEQRVGRSCGVDRLQLDASHVNLSDGKLESEIFENRNEFEAQVRKRATALEMRKKAGKEKDFATATAKRNRAKEMETESDERKKELHAEMDALLLAAHALPWQRLVNSWRASAGEAEEAKVTEDDDDILIEEVQVGEQLKVLNLRNCNLGGTALDAIFAAILAASVPLHALCVDCNPIGDDGSRVLAQFLCHSSQVYCGKAKAEKDKRLLSLGAKHVRRMDETGSASCGTLTSVSAQAVRITASGFSTLVAAVAKAGPQFALLDVRHIKGRINPFAWWALFWIWWWEPCSYRLALGLMSAAVAMGCVVLYLA
eukprot:g17086.t1